MDYPTRGVYDEKSSSEPSSNQDCENVWLGNHNEELERSVQDNQSGAPNDDENASDSAESIEIELSEQPPVKKGKF